MKSRVGALLGPTVFVTIWLLHLPVPAEAHRLAAIAALVIILWITEPIPIPVTALLGSALCILLGVAPVQAVLAPYADPIIFLFLGAFLVGEAMMSAGLDTRVARSVLAVPAMSSSLWRATATVGMLTMLLSMWMSNTAAAAILMPLAISMMRKRQGTGKRVGGDAVVLSVAYAASIGGIATPVGTPPNLIAIGFLERSNGVHVDFFTWMRVGVPLAVVLMIAMLAISALTLRGAQRPERAGGPVAGQPWSRAEATVAIVFGCMVIAWLLPSLLVLTGPASVAAVVSSRVPESLVALLGAIALFILPAANRPYQPVLKWQQTSNIDWGTILLFGGGLSLGGLVLHTGLGKWVGDMALQATGVHTPLGLIALSTATAIALTEFMSNTAATNVVVPVVYAMATSLSVNPIGPVVAAAFGASMAFMLPVSTPPNAIAYGTGEVTVAQMVRRGLVLDMVSFASIVTWVWFTFA